MFKLPKDTELTLDVIQDFVAKHKAIVATKFSKLISAYETRYEILDYPNKPRWKPDNRLMANFARYSVDTMTGFFAGIAPRIVSSDERVNDMLDFVNSYNVYDDKLAELTKYACIYGRDYEVLYVDDNGNIGFSRSSPMVSFMIYDDSILENKRAFVRLYKDSEGKITGSVSDSVFIRYFEMSPELKWTSEESVHGFIGVPAVEYKINEERHGLFEPVLSLINAYNKALSEKANDIDYFSDAYLKVLGPVVEEEDSRNIRDNRLINFAGPDADNADVDFLSKPDGDTSQEHLLDRLESLIFKISMVADISDDGFTGQSGIALKYKMLAMSNTAKVIERKFKSAMQERYRLIFSSATLKDMKEEDFTKVDYQFTLNYPANLLEETEIAKNLEAVTSKETQLRVISLIDNVKEELDRMDEETEKAASAYGMMRNE